MVETGKHYEQGVDLFRTGEIRLVLREESRMVAQALTELSRVTSLASAKAPIH
jgi:hypothetical protein